MRQVSIPKNVVDALNELFDAHPTAVTELMSARADIPQTHPLQEGETRQVDTVGVLDIVNAVLDKLSPGKRINTIHGPDGFDGFVLGRDRKPQSPQADECDR